jgi:hypothetical protein
LPEFLDSRIEAELGSSRDGSMVQA